MYSSVRAKHSRCTKVVNFAINAKNNPEKDSLVKKFDILAGCLARSNNSDSGLFRLI